MIDSPTWLQDTALLLRNRPSHIKLKTIAIACQVSVAWLSKLQTGTLENPPIIKIQRVNGWLKTNV